MTGYVPSYIFTQDVVIAFMLLPILHYLADFELQTNWMAINKSKRLDALFVHVMIYSSVFGLLLGWKFGVITFITHFTTDFLTSRWSSKWWKRSRHRFFCVIGFDQMVHSYSLILSVIWLQPNILGGLF